MERQIFEVHAKIVDANGTYNALSGYPKVFDSRHYNDDVEKTFRRAKADYNSTLGTLYTRDDRMLQSIVLMRVDGTVIERECIGTLNPPEEGEEIEEPVET